MTNITPNPTKETGDESHSGGSMKASSGQGDTSQGNFRWKSKNPKIKNFAELSEIRKKHQRDKVVHCHGVFDVLHAGHLAYFESAKKFGNILVVTVTADEYVNKGPGRPYFNAYTRAGMMAGLEIVDYVVINPNPLAVPAIQALQPDFYVKGPDYRDKSKDVTGGILLEEKAAEESGGKLVFTSDATFSSSTLVNQFFNVWNDEQIRIIKEVKELGGLSRIEEILEQISKEEIVVVGEPIIDTYIFCRPESISSKSPSISAKFLFEENYAGGSLAIANHLADFVKNTTLLTTHGDDSYFYRVIENDLDSRIDMISEKLEGTPTPRKTRFLSEEKSQRMFEITHLESNQWSRHSASSLCEKILSYSGKGTSLVIADFGHGMFDQRVLPTLADFNGFISLNVQTNSSNFGFNPFTKHKRFSYLSIDTREARVAYHDRFGSPIDLVRRIRNDYASKDISFSMTLGSNGAYFSPKGASREFQAPAFADQVVDTVGAGDAYFALTSMLVKVGCPDIMVPFIGNIFAGLKTRIIGNKTPVSKSQLVKAISSILK